MDVTLLLVPVMTALSTFLAGAADGAAHKLGEAAVEQSKRSYEAVKARFQKEADGGQAGQMLTLFEQNQKLRPAVEAERLYQQITDRYSQTAFLFYLLLRTRQWATGIRQSRTWKLLYSLLSFFNCPCLRDFASGLSSCAAKAEIDMERACKSIKKLVYLLA